MIGSDDRALLTEPSSLSLDGKVALGNGCNRGLGRALACAFAGAGASVLLSARSAEALDELAAGLRAIGVDVEVVAGSIADGAVVEATDAITRERWARLDVLVNDDLETDMTAGLRDHERWSASLLGRIPMGRFRTTAEVVGAVLFLAGVASCNVTGSTLFVVGGWAAQ